MICALTSESALNETEIETRHQIMLQGSSLDGAVDPTKSASLHPHTPNTNDELWKIVTFPTGYLPF